MEMERWDGGEERDPSADFPKDGNILVSSQCSGGDPLNFWAQDPSQISPPVPEWDQ